MRIFLALFCLTLSSAGLCEYIIPDGSGNFIGSDGSFYNGEGSGGFFTPDGKHFIDSGGGLYLGPQGEIYFDGGQSSSINSGSRNNLISPSIQ